MPARQSCAQGPCSEGPFNTLSFLRTLCLYLPTCPKVAVVVHCFLTFHMGESYLFDATLNTWSAGVGGNAGVG